ncbi:hypothetical protein FN846DRAFT_959983 [Sphaerosporella brunnea]|uniref:Translocon-associated protein subunit alpha n=1 Tax=Sphaerosporella brunnea TaxID=1250544 RepID=A0A5J5EPK3_9PEZI|nr:hypothetical protein FN846DRAFT_959983 [Sphaerosporella brunnea]
MGTPYIFHLPTRPLIPIFPLLFCRDNRKTMRLFSYSLPTLFFFIVSSGLATATTSTELRELNVKTGVDFIRVPPSPTHSAVLIDEDPRLVNGFPTRMIVHIENYEEEPITMEHIRATLLEKDSKKFIQNFTSERIGAKLDKDIKHTQPYSFVANLKQQKGELLVAIICSIGEEGSEEPETVSIQVWKGTVHVVDEDKKVGIFDLQILFLYTLIAFCVVGCILFSLATWFAEVPPPPRPRRRLERQRSESPPHTQQFYTKYEESLASKNRLRQNTGRGEDQDE